MTQSVHPSQHGVSYGKFYPRMGKVTMAPVKRKKIKILEGLERRVLHGLACEWEAGLWVLEPEHKMLMHKPLFSLQSMSNSLGYWSADKREICISRELILNHKWDSVREVLLHEMAHQLAVSLPGPVDKRPHGPRFQKACYLLRANPRASGKYGTLKDKVFKTSRSQEDRLMIRIRKLMALAESKNQYEAEAAMIKAHELIAKYNIDLLNHTKNRDYVSIFLGKPALRHFREENHLANLIQDFYFIEGLWVSSYVIEKEKMGRVLEITGVKKNIEIASYVYDFVKQFIDNQWLEYNKDAGLNRYRKTDFAVGIIEGFRSRLDSERNLMEEEKNLSALVKIEDAEMKEYMSYKYPYTTSSKRRSPGYDEGVMEDGIDIGKRLIISRGITSKGSASNLLIENKA